MSKPTFSVSRAVYLQGLRLLWSARPVDQALARGQISADEHRSIIEAISSKRLARGRDARIHWVVDDSKGQALAEITRRSDGTFTVRALQALGAGAIVLTSEEQCYRWIDAMESSRTPSASVAEFQVG